MSAAPEERWRRLAETASLSLSQARPLDEDRVEVGQIRDAHWGGAQLFVLILAVDDGSALARVAPLTFEPNVEDEHCVVLERSTVGIGTAAAVWPQASDCVSYSVLDQLAGGLSVELTRSLVAGHTSFEGVRLGGRRPMPGTGAAEALDALFDTLDELAAVPRWEAPVERPGTKLPISLPEIIEILDVPQSQAMLIAMGKAPLTSDQVESLARGTGLAVDDILASIQPLPAELSRELQEPRWRSAARDLMSEEDELNSRTLLGYEAYALAARGQGSGRELWRHKLEMVVSARRASDASDI